MPRSFLAVAREGSGSTVGTRWTSFASSANRSSLVCSRLTPHRVLAERRQELGSAAVPSDSVMVDDDRAAISILLAERDPYAADFAEFFLRTEGYRSQRAA
jgi:hypothetical protein